MNEFDRMWAARILSAASSNEPATLHDVAFGLGLDVTKYRAPLRVARRALAESIEAGNWREQRADAEARLRCAAPWRRR